MGNTQGGSRLERICNGVIPSVIRCSLLFITSLIYSAPAFLLCFSLSTLTFETHGCFLIYCFALFRLSSSLTPIILKISLPVPISAHQSLFVQDNTWHHPIGFGRPFLKYSGIDNPSIKRVSRRITQTFWGPVSKPCTYFLRPSSIPRQIIWYYGSVKITGSFTLGLLSLILSMLLCSQSYTFPLYASWCSFQSYELRYPHLWLRCWHMTRFWVPWCEPLSIYRALDDYHECGVAWKQAFEDFLAVRIQANNLGSAEKHFCFTRHFRAPLQYLRCALLKSYLHINSNTIFMRTWLWTLTLLSTLKSQYSQWIP